MNYATLPWYTDSEVDDLCTGLVNNAAKVRHLKRLGLTVCTKPNGRPLLIRAHAEAVLSGAAAIDVQTAALVHQRQAPAPNRAAFKLLYGKKAA